MKALRSDLKEPPETPTQPAKSSSGSGAPSDSDGKDGDLYLRTGTRVWYHKTGGSWVSIGVMLSI